MSLLLAACATAPTAGPMGPTARIGETARVGGLQVRPIRLLEDSRCPPRVQCIWAGRLRIEAVILMQGGSEELRQEMTLGEPLPLAEGKLTLSAAEPAPVAGKALTPDAYRFTFDLVP